MKIIASGWEIKILVVITTLFSISYAESILFPLVFSFFLYLLLNPLLKGLVRIRIPRIIAATLIIGLLFGVISSAISVLVQPAASWVEHAPEYFHTIEKKFKFLKLSLGKINEAAVTARDITEVSKKNKLQVVTQNTNLGFSLFDLTTNFLIEIFTILLFLFFMLIYFKTVIQNLEAILHTRRKVIKENIFLVRLENEISAYLFTFSLICAGLGSVLALAFSLLGLPNAILWGVMAMLLTFIPYLGHLIGILIILFVSLITFDSWFHILTPPLIYFLLTVLEGQIITPICLGRRLNLNPLVIFASMFVWSGLWGISGIFISIPLLITIKITLEHIPSLSKYAALMEKDASIFDKKIGL